jgi:group I intron endonuclease
MKLYRNRDLKKCGIYCIRNTINNKVYIGKSKNIYERIRAHINRLNKNSVDENKYFLRAWSKYGRNSFEYTVLEYVDNTIDDYEITLRERELYWIIKYKALDQKYGYNIRFDSKTNTVVNSLTKEKCSQNMKKRWKEDRELMLNIVRTARKNFTKEQTLEMAEKVSKSKRIYDFYQYDKNYNLLRVWDSVKSIIKENPTYKWNNIYAVCSGEKPTMYSYIWEKKHKEDIVRS